MELYNGSDCSEAISYYISTSFEDGIVEVANIPGCISFLGQFGGVCGGLNPTVSI